MITAPLARDQKGEPFELPDKADAWRVRVYTGGRPSDFLVDGEPLFVPVMSGEDTLIANGCSGPLSLLAVDAQRKPVGAQAAYVDLGTIATDEKPAGKNGHRDRDPLVDALVQTQVAMQRSQMEAQRAAAIRERAMTDAQIATMQALRDVVIDLGEKVRPVNALDVVREHSAMTKMFDRQRNGGGIEFVDASRKDEDDDDEELPKWVKRLAAAAPQLAEMVLPMVNPEHADKVRTAAAFLANSFGGGTKAGPSREVIDTTATVVQAHVELTEEVEEVIARMNDAEGEALVRFMSSLNPAAYIVFTSKACAVKDANARLAFVRARMNGQSPAASAPPPSAKPLEYPPVIKAVAAQLTLDEQAHLDRLMRADDDPVALREMESTLAKVAPANRLAVLRGMISEALRRETENRPNKNSSGGGEKP